MQVSAAAKWNPRTAIAPAISYLKQPVRLVRDYDRGNLRSDLLAGITVAVILLPQAIAFSLIADLPPQMGIYAAIVGGIVGALWGSSNQLHTGPTNAHSLLVLSVLSGAAVAGTDQYILAAGLLSVMVGALQTVLGMLRLGVLVNFVSHSVIVGFATGAAVLIAVRQLGPLLGLNLPKDNVLATLGGFATDVSHAHLLTAAIGLGSIAIIVLLKRINPKLPGPLVAMVLSSLAVFLLGDGASGIEVIGELAIGFPPLVSLPITDLELIRTLSVGALAVAAIGLVEATAISRSVADQTGQRLDSDQEFVGQGLANVAAGFFSGFSVAGSFSRTVVNFGAGARTPLAAIFSSIFVLIILFSAGSLGSYLPVSALSGVLIVTAVGMIDRDEIGRILRGGRGDAVIMIVTFLGTLFLHVEFAVLVGIILSFARYVMRTSTPRIHEVLPDEEFRHFTYQPDEKKCPQLAIVEIQGDLYFGAVHHVEEFLLDLLAEETGPLYLLIRMHQVNTLDFTGIHMLEAVIGRYRARGGDVFMVRVSYRCRQVMEQTGFIDYLGEDHILDDDEAVGHIFYHVLDPVICIYECPVRAFKECQNLPKRLDLIELKESDPVVFGRKIELKTIAPSDLWDVICSADTQYSPAIIDVREPREFAQSHIDGAASLPLSEMLKPGFVPPADCPVVLVCRTGRRSRRAAQLLRDSGCEDMAILEGGMSAWQAAGLLEAVGTTL